MKSYNIFIILLLYIFFIGIVSCDKSDVEKDFPVIESNELIIDFKALELEEVKSYMEGGWKVLSQNDNENGLHEVESALFRFGGMGGSVSEFQVDTTYLGINLKWIKNDYGYEVSWDKKYYGESHFFSRNAIWLLGLKQDTLYYTSPQYPPAFLWTAKRIEDPFVFEYELLETTTYDRHVYHDLSCKPTSVDGEPDEIIGNWKLVKHILSNDTIDYSCKHVIYEFSSNGVLTIKSDVEDFKNENFNYEFHGYCPFELLPEPRARNLAIEETRFFCDVLIRKMIIRSMSEIMYFIRID